MKVLTKMAIAGFGGAAAVASTVGFGGVAFGTTGGASTMPRPLTSTTSLQQDTAPVVHMATLTGCIAGANC